MNIFEEIKEAGGIDSVTGSLIDAIHQCDIALSFPNGGRDAYYAIHEYRHKFERGFNGCAICLAATECSKCILEPRNFEFPNVIYDICISGHSGLTKDQWFLLKAKFMNALYLYRRYGDWRYGCGQ